MPYIITTTSKRERRDLYAAADALNFDSEQRRILLAEAADAPNVVSRRAVATLEDAREQVWRSISSDTLADVRPYGSMSDAVAAIDESGGTVGPLPDGTVIEVTYRSWPELEAERYPDGVPGGFTGDPTGSWSGPRSTTSARPVTG